MKTLHVLFFCAAFCLFSNPASSQVNIVSSNGYTVNVVIMPKAVVTSTTNCTWGYNYNLRIDYSVTFTGSNRPASLYTLQGNFGCGPSTHFFSLPVSGGNGSLVTQSNVWRSTSDCASASINSLHCNTVQLTAAGPGISNGNVTFHVNSTPLPVKLTAFNVQATGHQVEISWTTESEENNDYFTVERSTDGSTWTVVKIIPGVSGLNSPADYIITDTDPLPGLSYYRLKQTDVDGKSTYSDTRQVKTASKEGISLFPVPNNGRTLYFRGISDPRQVSVSLRNTAGQILYQGQLTGTTLELPKLAPGLYFISFKNQATGILQQEKYIQL